MANTSRWQQRFQNFENAFRLLKKLSTLSTPSEGEILGIIQAFEVTFELSWKVLGDFFKMNGFEVSGPREIIKLAFQEGHIIQGEKWLMALEDRNATSHIYDEERIREIITNISTNYITLFQNFHDKFSAKH